MNMTYKTMEKVFRDEDLRKIFGGGCIGVGVLCLFGNSKDNLKIIISSSVGLGVYGLLEYLERL